MAHDHEDFKFDARWGHDLAVSGIDTIPHVVVKHMGSLGLSNAEFALIVQAFSFKWTENDPHPSAATLAGRMGTSVGTVRNITQSLRKKGYLKRESLDPKKSIWSWDFSDLLRKALELECPELPIFPGGATFIGAGGATSLGAAETEAVESEELKTEATTRIQEFPPLEVLSEDGDDVVVDADHSLQKELFNDLLEEGIRKKKARDLMRDHDYGDIRRMVDYVRNENGTIRNHAGFIIRGLQEGWDLTWEDGRDEDRFAFLEEPTDGRPSSETRPPVSTPEIRRPGIRPISYFLPPPAENQKEINTQGAANIQAALNAACLPQPRTRHGREDPDSPA